MKFRLALFVLAFTTLAAYNLAAGIRWVDVGVNGLTCSMCTRSVEMSLSRLDFVDSIAMSLETTDGRIYLRENMPVDFSSIAKAVVNAGFSVRFVRVAFDFRDIPINADGTFYFQDQKFDWLDFKNNTNNPVSLRIINEHFLPKKDANKWKDKIRKSEAADANTLHVIEEL
jgi:hypothetical protein